MGTKYVLGALRAFSGAVVDYAGWDALAPPALLASYFASTPTTGWGVVTSVQARLWLGVLAVIIVHAVSYVARVFSASLLASALWGRATTDLTKCMLSVTAFLITGQSITPARDSPVHIPSELVSVPVVLVLLLAGSDKALVQTSNGVDRIATSMLHGTGLAASILSTCALLIARRTVASTDNSVFPLDTGLAILSAMLLSAVHAVPSAATPIPSAVAAAATMAAIRAAPLLVLTLVMSDPFMTANSSGDSHSLCDYYSIRVATNHDTLGTEVPDTGAGSQAEGYSTQLMLSTAFVRMQMLVVACVYFTDFRVHALAAMQAQSAKAGQAVRELYTVTASVVVCTACLASSLQPSSQFSTQGTTHTIAPAWASLAMVGGASAVALLGLVSSG